MKEHWLDMAGIGARDNQSIRNRFSKLEAEINRWKHGERYRMTIPVLSSDTDMIVAAVANDQEYLFMALTERDRRIAQLERELDDCKALEAENKRLLGEIERLKSELAIAENGRSILKGTIDRFVNKSKPEK